MLSGTPRRVDSGNPDDALFFRSTAINDAVMTELREWATFEEAAGGSRSGSVDAVLTLQGLLVAATTGVIGNAAWSLFPAAGRWLRDRRLGEREFTAPEVLAEVRECLKQVDPEATADLTVDALKRTDEGGWLVRVVSGTRTYELTATRSGDVVRVRRRS